jgi:23S rRNA (pseudouridine1915-N3)-methyltransferase
MNVVVAAVGKPRHAALAASIREYEQRAARYWPLLVREVREEPARGGLPEVARDREGERLLARLRSGTLTVVCDETGQSMTSAAFAAWLQQERERATRDVAFLLGGPYGHGAAVRGAASMTLALAPWTVPHELARLILDEQLYRAGTILRREPYHK